MTYDIAAVRTDTLYVAISQKPGADIRIVL